MLSEMPLPGVTDGLEPASGEMTPADEVQTPAARDRTLRCRYSATFEFEAEKPVTVTGQTEAGSIAPMLRHAVRMLQQLHPRRQWSSVVVVLERV